MSLFSSSSMLYSYVLIQNSMPQISSQALPRTTQDKKFQMCNTINERKNQRFLTLDCLSTKFTLFTSNLMKNTSFVLILPFVNKSRSILLHLVTRPLPNKPTGAQNICISRKNKKICQKNVVYTPILRFTLQTLMCSIGGKCCREKRHCGLGMEARKQMGN